MLDARARELGLAHLLKPAPETVPTAREAVDVQSPGWQTARQRGPSFSLFFFSDNGSALGTGKYDLLTRFHRFGGLYPNPAILGAALATATTRVGIRAGSVVLPLHHPARVVEEWSVVDNLSGGRVGVAFASGWRSEDFVLAGTGHAHRKDVTTEALAVVQALWRGDLVPFETIDGARHHLRTFPRPIQPELPTWLAVAGNPESWRLAGRMGVNVLTMLGTQTVPALATKIAAYDESLAEQGHSRAQRTVTVVVHAFVGDNEKIVREAVRVPLQRYLANFLSQFDAARRPGAAPQPDGVDRDQLCAAAFDWYYEGAGLFGTPDRCRNLVGDLLRIGADEIACLLDFGVDPAAVLASLPYLNELREDVARQAACRPEESV
jgi:natural product biosynthesis luciferase-like monooxygenase protein